MPKKSCIAILLATAIVLGRPAMAQTGYDQIVEILRLSRQFKQPLLSKREMDFSAAAVASRRARIAAWQPAHLWAELPDG